MRHPTPRGPAPLALTLALTLALLLTLPLASAFAGAIPVVWSSPTTADLDGVALTMTAPQPVAFEAIFEQAFSGPDYAAAPLPPGTSYLTYDTNADWTASFDAPVSGLLLYAAFWRGLAAQVSPEVTYTFDRPFTIISGLSEATVSGHTLTLPDSGYHDGIIRFDGELSSVSVETNSPTFSSQALTFAREVEPECFLVIGDPTLPGGAFSPYSHAFEPQVGQVEQWHPVLLDEIPSFVIWDGPGHQPRTLDGLGASVSLSGAGDDPSAGELPRFFAAEVLMWNPQAFPAQPEQHTYGLAVWIGPGGSVVSVPYGSSEGGMQLWAETSWNEQGQKVLTLPFSIPGFDVTGGR